MEIESTSNPYEEARMKRVKENLKHLEGLGLSTISKSLLEVAKCESKSYSSSTRSARSVDVSELRRSSRARNLVSSYRDEIDIDLHAFRRSYAKRKHTEVRFASYEERVHATKRAEKHQADLKSGNPSFVKPMVRSHVSGCFWLGLPTKFCKNSLPLGEIKMVLEDEKGAEYDAVYIGGRTGLSGGWRGFSLDHNLDDGDALLFELTQPDRFKVFIFKASESSGDISDDIVSNSESDVPKPIENVILEPQEWKPLLKTGSAKRVKRPPTRSACV